MDLHAEPEPDRRVLPLRWRAHKRPCTQSGLTQLVKVRVAAVGSWHGADQTGLEECGPLVDQTPLAAHVILMGNTTRPSAIREAAFIFHHLIRLYVHQPQLSGLYRLSLFSNTLNTRVRRPNRHLTLHSCPMRE